MAKTHAAGRKLKKSSKSVDKAAPKAFGELSRDSKGGRTLSPKKSRPQREAGSSRAADLALAAFAHDIRTPLTGILAFTDLLATSSLGGRERQWVAAIRDAAEHLTSITTLVLDGTRASSGQLTPRRDVFDLTRLVGALSSSLAVRAEAKGLSCQVVIDPALPAHVVGDATLLRAALENLAANALKFTERGSITFEARCSPHERDELRLAFSISDTGIGMTAAEARRAFHPFAQANRDIVEKFGGAGIGLSQVRRLATVMGGSIDVESMPDRGTTFRLEVTVGKASPTSMLVSGRDVTKVSDSCLKLLCVEDNPFGRVVLNALLRELGHEVHFAASGEEAIERIRGERGPAFDAVLMDITLEGIDGFETTRRIHALPEGTALPVIGISGHMELAETGLASGMTGWLGKPVNLQELAGALAKVSPGRSRQ